jgi:hypothetical protein
VDRQVEIWCTDAHLALRQEDRFNSCNAFRGGSLEGTNREIPLIRFLDSRG